MKPQFNTKMPDEAPILMSLKDIEVWAMYNNHADLVQIIRHGQSANYDDDEILKSAVVHLTLTLAINRNYLSEYINMTSQPHIIVKESK